MTGSRSAGIRVLVAMIGAVVVLGTASGAYAQGSRYGDTQFPRPPDGTSSGRRFPGVAYDAANNVFLVTSGVIHLGARFVSSEGVPLGSPVAISTDGVERQAGAVRVGCAANLNACLIAWVEESPARIVGRFARYNGGEVQFLTDRFVINANGNAKHTESAPAVTYSPVAGEFLVSWAEYPGPNVFAQRINASGGAVGAVIPIAVTGYWEGMPSATYNSAEDEFFVAYYLEPGMDAVGGTRVKPGTGQIMSNGILYSGLFEKYPEVVYNSVANQYLAITWSSGFTLHGQIISSSGNANGPVLSLGIGGGDGIGVAYSPVANTYLAVYQHSSSDETWGTVVTPAGSVVNQFQVTVSGTRLAPQPQAVGSTVAPRFLVVASEFFRQIMSQMVQSGTSTTPPPSAPPPTSPTPTPPPPTTDPAVARERARSDFDGDGKYDILWHEQGSGYIAAWTLNGVQLIDSILFSHRISDPNWQIVGTSDFNSDGKPDVVWQHLTEGWIGIWYMNGTTLIDSVYFSVERVLDTGWKIVGVGDFNGDGKPDLAWQHSTERWLAAWLLDGVRVVDSVLLSPQKINDARWEIVAVGDLNRDGKSDLVWRHREDGQIACWLMDGVSLMYSFGFQPGVVADNNWKIVGIIDANYDSKPDLLWHHTIRGEVGVWYMDGDALIDSVSIGPGVVPPSWKVVGPR